MPRPSRPPGLIIRTIFGEASKSGSYSVRSLLQSAVTSSPRGQNEFLSTLCANTVGLHRSRNLKDQVSNPYKTTSKIIVAYQWCLLSVLAQLHFILFILHNYMFRPLSGHLQIFLSAHIENLTMPNIYFYKMNKTKCSCVWTDHNCHCYAITQTQRNAECEKKIILLYILILMPFYSKRILDRMTDSLKNKRRTCDRKRWNTLHRGKGRKWLQNVQGRPRN
jgi:hypothetical protein